MTPLQRKKAYKYITETAISYNIVFISNKEIDSLGIQKANYKAIFSSIKSLKNPPSFILSDYLSGYKNCSDYKFYKRYIKFFKSGESVSITIAAASILAKVERDKYMKEEAHEKYPDYGFDKHKGYGTKLHFEKILKHGPCPLHRKSFNLF